MVMVPERAAPVLFGGYGYSTEALPVPDAPDVRVIHGGGWFGRRAGGAGGDGDHNDCRDCRCRRATPDCPSRGPALRPDRQGRSAPAMTTVPLRAAPGLVTPIAAVPLPLDPDA